MKLYRRDCPGGKTSWYIHYSDESGRRKRTLLKGISDAKTADLAFQDFKLRHERGLAGLPSNETVTVGQCVDSYYESKAASCTPGHLKVLEARVKQIKERFGNTLVKSLSERAVNAWRADLKRQKQAPPTINKKLGVLRGAIDRAVHMGTIGANPIKSIENLSDPRPPRWRWLEEAEIDALLDTLKEGAQVKVKCHDGRQYRIRRGKDLELYRLTTFMLNTGCREGEALALTWRALDLDRNQVEILTRKRAARGRSARPRYVPLNDSILGELRAMKAEAEEKGQGLDAPAFTISRFNLMRKFALAVKYAGLEGRCRLHDLGHTAASWLVMRGVPLAVVKEILGHSTLSMTAKYAHLSPKSMADAAGVLNFGAGKAQSAKVIPVTAELLQRVAEG